MHVEAGFSPARIKGLAGEYGMGGVNDQSLIFVTTSKEYEY